MAFTTFPTYAQWLLDGYQVAPTGGVERTEMDDGYVHQAPIQSLSRYEQPLTYRLASLADMEAFETWRRVDLRNGALYFAWPDVAYPSGTKVRRARIMEGKVIYKLLTDRMDEWTVAFNLEYYA